MAKTTTKTPLKEYVPEPEQEEAEEIQYTIKRNPDNPNYVEHGSFNHAVLLGLRKANDEDEIQQNGWTLRDFTSFGAAATERYIKGVLSQKVRSLKAPAPRQSVDPFGPSYSPEMWLPDIDKPAASGRPTDEELQDAIDTLTRAKMFR